MSGQNAVVKEILEQSSGLPEGVNANPKVSIAELSRLRVVAVLASLAAVAFLIAFIFYIVRYNSLSTDLQGYTDPEPNGFLKNKIPIKGAGVAEADFGNYKELTLPRNPRGCVDICRSDLANCRSATYAPDTGICALYKGEAMQGDPPADAPLVYTYFKQSLDA